MMSSLVWSLIDDHLRLLYALTCGLCFAMLGFGMYLQYSVGLEPCPMCIVQRYALIFVAIVAGLTGTSAKKSIHISGALLLLLGAGFGAFVAARQSWLQWYPPQVATCGRDFYGMIESFPLQRVIPMIFKGSGDCAAVHWTFLGGSIANWSFICFVGFGALALLILWRKVIHKTH
jgi:disulfide bond formation protein DsbB